MGKKYQSYATKIPAIYLFGKGRESLRLQTLHKKLSALSVLPLAHKKHSDSDNVWTTHAKIDQN